MKKFLLLTALIISVLLPSCKKSDSAASSNENGNNNGGNSQEQLYEWFIDEGWHDAIVSYGNSCNGTGGFYMEMESNGTIVGKEEKGGAGYGRWEEKHDYRLYSTFDKVKELSAIPNDGYTNTFVCEDTRCGITRKYRHTYSVSSANDDKYYWDYCKFYVERINSNQVKVYYKEWESIVQ